MNQKLYIIRPRDLGMQFIVIGVNKTDALSKLIAHFQTEAEKESQANNEKPAFLYNYYYQHMYDTWKNATIRRLPDDYIIQVLKGDDVYEIEFS